MGPTLTSTQKSVLAMSKSQYLSLIKPTNPAHSLRVGAAIFRMDLRTSRPTILLLKLASNPFGPATDNMFELPSGKVEDGDWAVSDAVARAVREMTGLKVFRVLGMLSENRTVVEHMWLDKNMVETIKSYECVQLNWTVLVENPEDVVMDCEDLELEFVWASWNALEMLNMAPETRGLAKEALEWASRCLY